MLELVSTRVHGSGGNKKNASKPVTQALSRLTKDHVGLDRNLLTTMTTLIQSGKFNEIGPIIATTRTAQAIFAFSPDDTTQTVFLEVKPLVELPGVFEKG